MTRSQTGSGPEDAVLREFRARHGGSEPRLFFAPGRINLVGAHLDYNGGDVLPLAVHRGIYVAARLRDDGRIRLHSVDQQPDVELPVDEVGVRADPEHGWAAYPLGVWCEFARETDRRAGVDLVFAGDLAIASGLSSSAAIEVATAFALDALHGTGLAGEPIARLAHRAETDYVGLQCGIMDQYASALGRRGHLLLLHCGAPTYEHVPVDAEAFEVLVMDTRKRRRLQDSRFNERVAECAAAHAVLRREVRDLPCLAAYSLADLDAAGAALPAVLRRRARHVVTEMERIRAGVAGLRRGDIGALGEAMNGSHASARDDYEVTGPELDAITELARSHADVYGARFTGAGFGGCAIALVRHGCEDAVAAHVGAGYAARFGLQPAFDSLHAGPGPREIPV